MNEHPDSPALPGTPSLSYTASSLPPGLTLDSATGLLTGRIDLTFTAGGQDQRGSRLSPDGKTSTTDVLLLVFRADLPPGVRICPG